jgi:hypothetical protein
LGWLQDICTNGEFDIPLLRYGENLELYITALSCNLGRAHDYLLGHLLDPLSSDPFLADDKMTWDDLYNLRLLPECDPVLCSAVSRIALLLINHLREGEEILCTDPQTLHLIYEETTARISEQIAKANQQKDLGNETY